MPNPVFYERQRRRASTWDIPRYLQNFDETASGGLVLPRGLLDRLNQLIVQAGSKLELTDERTAGASYEFGFAATLDPDSRPRWTHCSPITSACSSHLRARARQ